MTLDQRLHLDKLDPWLQPSTMPNWYMLLLLSMPLGLLLGWLL